MFAKFRLFQKTAVLLFLTYMGLMVYVTCIAMLRPSGVAGIDPAQMVQTRNKATKEKEQENKIITNIEQGS